MQVKQVLVTGAAGFIGFHLVEKLLSEGYSVVGLDNLNDYYDVNLKYARLGESGIQTQEVVWNKPVLSANHNNYRFIQMNLEDKDELLNLFSENKFSLVINLAAQAGVRYSIENPDVYISSNINGFFNLLEACRKFPVEHMVFASSSSVYGDSDEVPFQEEAMVDKPISLYAATKKSGELMAYTYSHLYNIPITGLRFFTVYGPWGRPDMALSLFTEKILNDEPIKVFNNGKLSRDFTYIDDIVEGINLTLNNHELVSAEAGNPPYRILNIGNNSPVALMDFVRSIEKASGKKARIQFEPMQPGDVHQTWADVSRLMKMTGYTPDTNLEEGVSKTVRWHINYLEQQS